MADTLPILWVDGAPSGPVRQVLRRRGQKPFLTLWRLGDELWLGPLHEEGAPGCLLCLWERLYRTSSDRTLFEAQGAIERGRLVAFPLFPPHRILVESLVQAESAAEVPVTRSAVYRLSLRTGELERHPLIPVPDCPACGVRPRARRRPPARLQAVRGSVPKADSRLYRGATEPPDLTRLRHRFVDERTGLILNELHHDRPGPIVVAESKLVLADRPAREPGIGRAFTWAEAEVSALLEALERHAGIERTADAVVTGAQADLGELAIDPQRLLLHHPSAYGESLTAYSPRLSIDWVWAHSFSTGARLVPEQAVTYGPLPGPRFLVETSSGCAVGRSVPEAAFHALLELIERDAFLLTWHGALPVPPIDLADCPDGRVRRLAQHLSDQGFGLQAFRTTTDVGIPAVLLLTTMGGQPFLCAAGAHPDPVKAVLGGLLEVAVGAEDLRPAWQAYRPLGDPDPARLRLMDEHPTFHWHPALRPAWSFLLEDRPRLSWREAFPDHWPAHGDLQDDLRHLVGRLGAVGLEVLIADQTPRALAAEGLHAVRALVPGALPLAFGHRRRRIEGAPRLLEAPARMGYGAAGLRNPWPHPFG